MRHRSIEPGVEWAAFGSNFWPFDHLRRGRVRLRGGLRAGAKGYLSKDTSIEELVSAIAKAGKSETILGSPIAVRLVSNLKMTPASGKEDPAVTFSGQELGILNKQR